MFSLAPPVPRAGRCVPGPAFPTAGLNLSAQEKEMLPFICVDPRAVGSPPRLSARRGVPPGVTCNRTQW